MKILPDKNITAAFLLTSSLIILVFAFLVDLKILGGRTIILEGRPNFDLNHLFRTALISLSSFLIVVNMVNYSAAISPDRTISRMRSAGSCPGRLDGFQAILLVVMMLLSLYFLFLFLRHPQLFIRLSKESASIETYSARLLFLSCIVFSLTTLILHKKRYKSVAFLFVLVFFLVGMEEVSWFQHTMGFSTPEFFNANKQGEVNLHNFATNEVENMYYFSSFVFLILIPFVYDKLPSFRKYHFVHFFVPRRFIIFFSAVSVAYNYDMWNIPFTQFAFFITLFIVAYYGWSCRGLNRSCLLLVLLASLCLVSQYMFLRYGSTYYTPKKWVLTEYKELFIPLSFALYSIHTLHRAWKYRRLPVD